jgi:TrmH family RNA methyltransferase
MGTAFRLPIWTGPAYSEAIQWCRERGITTACADAEATTDYTDLDWTKANALLVGPESTGFTAEELMNADRSVKIPMQGLAESLNVSVAAGILLFEAARQRAAKIPQ